SELRARCGIRGACRAELGLAELRRRMEMANKNGSGVRVLARGAGALLLAGTSISLGVGCNDESKGLAPSTQAPDCGTTGSGGASATTCPSPVPVFNAIDPLDGHTCHPSSCTPGFCARGDIAPLATEPQTRALQDRLTTIDCSPHSVSPLTIFAEATPPG